MNLKKIIVTFFIIALILGTSLSAVSMVAASSEEENQAGETGQVGESEHSHEEEDIEEGTQIESQEDNEGNLHITSEDNTIEFEIGKPQIHFTYIQDETEIAFEATNFALIEFVDQNDDDKIQSQEIKQKLEVNTIPWTSSYEKTIEDENTIITTTYYANSIEYEVSLVMRVYQRRVTISSPTQNSPITFDLDGGADEVKFDLIVNRWTWVNQSSKLALHMELKNKNDGDVTFESASLDKDQIAIKLDNIKIKVGWVKEAKVIAANGNEELVNVTVSYESLDLQLEESNFESELDIYFIYPYFSENKMIHDPSFGIEDDLLLYIFTLITPEFLLGTAIIPIVITLIAIAITRQRKRVKI
jgi:hypothetical protein